MTTNKAITLIRKLLNLAEEGSGATEAEASLALEKARELMADANLTMATLEAAGQSGGEGSARTEDQLFSRSPYPWKRKLMAGVAELNSVYCRELYRRASGGDGPRVFTGYQMVGREANLASTKVMFEYLVQAVTRVQREFVSGDLPRTRDAAAHTFREGCAARLVERLQDRHEEEVRAQERRAAEERARQSHPGYAGGGALVVVMADYYRDERDLNNDLVNGWEPGTTARRRRKYEAESAAASARYQEHRAKRRAEVDRLVAEGVAAAVAGFMVSGFSRERAEELAGGEEAEREARPRRGASVARRPGSALGGATRIGSGAGARRPGRVSTRPATRRVSPSAWTARSAETSGGSCHECRKK